MAGAVLVGELVALAVGALWVALTIRRHGAKAGSRLKQAMVGQLVAPALELQEPFSKRVLEPMIHRGLQYLGRLSPRANLERLRRQLLVAGSPFGLEALDYLGVRMLLATLGALGLGLLVGALTRAPLRAALAALTGGLLLSELPNFFLYGRMRRRRKQITLALPDALDMLTVCVDGGLGLENAFLRIAESWDHALAREFRRAVAETGLGIGWRDSMRNLVYRTDVPELSSLVAVLLQADQLGFSISTTLHTQADQMRMRRRQRAQEMARAAPFKMLFPMVFFIMPATFVVVLGPAVPAILEVLGGVF